MIRLVLIEVSKACGTRGSKLLIILGLMVPVTAISILSVLAFPDRLVPLRFLIDGLKPFLVMTAGLLAITTMCSDWQTRFSTFYFPAVSRRSHIYLARILAIILLNLALCVSGLIVATVVAASTAATLGKGLIWTGVLWPAESLIGLSFFVTLLASGLAALVRNSTGTIVTLVVVLLGSTAGLTTLPLPTALEPLLFPLTPVVLLGDPTHAFDGLMWWQLLGSIGLWYALPLAAGLEVMKRAEG